MSNEFHSSRPHSLSADSSNERESTGKPAANVRFAVPEHNAPKTAVQAHSPVGATAHGERVQSGFAHGEGARDGHARISVLEHLDSIVGHINEVDRYECCMRKSALEGVVPGGGGKPSA